MLGVLGEIREDPTEVDKRIIARDHRPFFCSCFESPNEISYSSYFPSCQSKRWPFLDDFQFSDISVSDQAPEILLRGSDSIYSVREFSAAPELPARGFLGFM
jgi:hypothetical protein